MDNAFLDLVKKYDGFEFVLGFRGDEDHWLGGKDNTVWYHIGKENDVECWMGKLQDGKWTDKHFVIKGKDFKEEGFESGKTMEMILERAYFKQKEIAESGYKPTTVSVYEHPCSHYSFSFGAKAYKISDEYGVTVEYSNIDDEAAGYRLRAIDTGANVKVPNISKRS